MMHPSTVSVTDKVTCRAGSTMVFVFHFPLMSLRARVA